VSNLLASEQSRQTYARLIGRASLPAARAAPGIALDHRLAGRLQHHLVDLMGVRRRLGTVST
jgi:hypothetical protein